MACRFANSSEEIQDRLMECEAMIWGFPVDLLGELTIGVPAHQLPGYIVADRLTRTHPASPSFKRHKGPSHCDRQVVQLNLTYLTFCTRISEHMPFICDYPFPRNLEQRSKRLFCLLPFTRRGCSKYGLVRIRGHRLVCSEDNLSGQMRPTCPSELTSY